VRDWELVAGKWLGSFLFFLTLIAITLIYPLILNQITSPGIDMGVVAAGYLGVILLTAAMCALGVFVSSLFSNQLAALFASLGLVILLWIISAAAELTSGVPADVLRYLSLREHFYSNFVYGIVELKDIVYFISITVLALFMGTRAVETRRWR
jgi:ABC-2 type transport system permease protein